MQVCTFPGTTHAQRHQGRSSPIGLIGWVRLAALGLCTAMLGSCGDAQLAPPPQQGVTVLEANFDGAIPAAIDPGTATLTDVEGFAGLGPAGNQFGVQMLRSATANTVTISLTGLPAHTWLSLEFLFAAIDSLDGTGTFPAGDFLEVKVDGTSIFNESFANADPNQIQSYVPPDGGELARRVELGFWESFPESAYNMAIDTRFQHIPHSADTAVITFRMEGSGEDLFNESWGIDNLKVIVGP